LVFGLCWKVLEKEGVAIRHFGMPAQLTSHWRRQIVRISLALLHVQVWDAASDTQIGVATQQPDGSWAYTFTSDLTEGLHQVYVKV
ncbi:hypothetical protein MJM28_28365, partial [Salmonella enterica subsp. enterica serovar Montevideo]|nr:hypothetical protein [Salmonella enterica subsp. enterica serovar Montevideo]